jgi:hypothetical protein
VEADGAGLIYPVVYIRQAGRLEEHALPAHPLLDFATPDHVAALGAALAQLVPSVGAA